jgi:hypothetical protein
MAVEEVGDSQAAQDGQEDRDVVDPLDAGDREWLVVHPLMVAATPISWKCLVS